MTKINENINLFGWIYKIGFFIILLLPALIAPPYFFPADWGKSIVFRIILSIFLFLFLYQVFYKKNTIPATDIKNNKIVWLMGAYFIVFLLASIFSVDPNFSFWGSPFRGGGFVNFGFCFLYAILFFIFLNKKDWQIAWIVSIITGILVCGLALIQYYGLFNNLFVPSNQPPSTMGSPIILAIYLLLLFFPTLSFAISEQNIRLKIFYLCSLALFAFTILISETRAVYLGIFISAIYFLLFYPKKHKFLKLGVIAFSSLVFFAVIYANTNPQLPKFLENKITKKVAGQLLIKNVLGDERFRAWQIIVKEINDKPVLGYGPENLSIGFDKNYDSKIVWSTWWDRAHNIFLDVAVQTGILGMLAQIALFIVLLWQLGKNRNIITLGLQSSIIGYLVAGFFSLDTLSVYLVLFLIIAYSLHLTTQPKTDLSPTNKKAWWKPTILCALFLFLIIFLWQYNFVPLSINANINKATTLAKNKDCTGALKLMDQTLLKRSFLDSYLRMEYIEVEKICSEYYPQNAMLYTKRGLEVLTEAVKIQPLYTRYWIDLGELATALIDQEDDPTKKAGLAKQARFYFEEALKLAPRHQEIYTALTELEIAVGNYTDAKTNAQKCIDINPATGDCYFYMAVSQIYLKDIANGKVNLQKAEDMGVDIGVNKKLVLLSNAYASIPDYPNLATLLEKLIAKEDTARQDYINKGGYINPNEKPSTTYVQYHSTLAFIYSKLGQFSKARAEALRVMLLSPESKNTVNEFLKTLP